MYQAPLPTNHDPQPPSRQAPVAKEPFVAYAIPAVSYSRDAVHYGDASSTSKRSFTPIKAVGDGSFGTVWLCDWHGPLPPNTPLPAMQTGAGARPEYVNKTLVAVKRMKKKWENGWDECKRLKEIEALRAIPMHQNIIPLYDAFLLPDSKELYFVFEPMEGHLFQLIKARKGRPLAGGLVASIFRQIVSGLDHIHLSGYFHRDMKPENVLVTTTGLHDYANLSPAGGPVEKDVVAIIKLADFGLARETKSKPPYTEYVSTRWYRAPEVLLKCRHYSNPVDMWALGTIMAELVNLRPLFPGKNEYDQISRICEVLGDPSDEYGYDGRGKAFGGGRWQQGIKLGKSVGFEFPKTQPKDISALFDRNVPPLLIECIADLLKYDPSERLTSHQCLEHPYLLEAAARSNVPPTLSITTSAPVLVSHRNGVPSPNGQAFGASPRAPHPAQISTAPNGHSHMLTGSNGLRQSYYSTSSSEWEQQHAQAHQWNDQMHPSRHQAHQSMSSASSYPSIQSPRAGEWITYGPGDIQEMDVQTSPMAVEHPSRPPIEPEPMAEMGNGAIHNVSKPGKVPIFGGFRKAHNWRFFGNGEKAQQNGLPVVDEVDGMGSTSLKRSQSSSTSDSHSLPDVQVQAPEPPQPVRDPRKVKQEAKLMQREAELQRRALREKNHREQARAVMEKRNAALRSELQAGSRSDLEWKYQHHAALLQPGQHECTQAAAGLTKARASSMFGGPTSPYHPRPDERMHKVRRRDLDDDHSMSSSDVQSIGPASTISFATVDSDPGPSMAPRPDLRPRPSMLGINRGASSGAMSPLNRQFDEFSVQSIRSSHSFEQQFVNEFHQLRASVDSSSLSDAGSPPPVHALTLSPQHSWQTVTAPNSSHDVVMAQPQPSRLFAPPRMGQPSPLGYHPGARAPGLTPSPGMDAPKSAINPIFKVPSLPSLKSGMPILDRANAPPTPALPPFSQLEAIAMGEYPPLSPMAFTVPIEES
ncbi:kinase-like domain-containing protein [Vararia minispora EC-137]|uniref:Kinase-like domain-containing protein n=1 Tax=Vararia minispora EC-137 TaxID=1314806 RepID=A0ACB8QHN9_9AGAM|nr:kinase-like domain-containing protein [Vararia minispora EC-137]